MDQDLWVLRYDVGLRHTGGQGGGGGGHFGAGDTAGEAGRFGGRRRVIRPTGTWGRGEN